MRRYLIVIALTLLSLLFPCFVRKVVGQKMTSAQEGSTGKLIDLNLDNGRLPISGDKCGKYFRHIPASENYPEMVGFIFLPIKSDGPDHTLLVSFPVEEYRLRIVNGTSVPTTEIIHNTGPESPWAEIAISQSDLKEAVCLGKVKQSKNAQ